MSNDLVSVIIPAYNAEATIVETVNSVLAQTYANFELIIIDDGSSDRTWSLLQNLADSRIKVYSYENAGVSTARNRGIERSQGEFVSFLDADDCWTPNKLELQIAALQNSSQAALAYSWVYFKSEIAANSYADTSVIYTGNVYAELLLKNFLHNGSNALIRSNILKEVGLFDPQLKAAEDWDFYLRIAVQHDFVLVPETQIIYRQSATSMTGNVQLMEDYLTLVINRAYKTAPAELQYLKPQTWGWTYKYIAQQYLKYQFTSFKLIKLAIYNLYRAINVYPLNIFDTFTQFLIKTTLKKSLKQISNKCLNIAPQSR
ncbi:MAG: glycosyltransferase [Cyanobacteria bacterium J06621_12]